MTPAGSREGAPRRAGRPRSDARPVVGDPTDAILAAASRLIGELGVGGTPMSRIASEVGLKQSSLDYYFRRKEEILAALVARANVVPLALIGEITSQGGPPAVQVYRFVQADVAALCDLPFDINDIHRIAMRDREGFSAYWKERASLERKLAALIKQGTAEGHLMSDRLASTWVAFAKTGNPNNATIPSWPAYDGRRRATMVFDKDMRVADDYRGEFVRMIADAVPGTPDPRKA